MSATEESEFLSEADVQYQTGYKRPTFQAQWCEANNVDYKLSSKGRVRISRHDVRGRSLRTFKGRKPAEPNLTSV